MAIESIDLVGWNAHFRLTGETLHILVDDQDVTTRCFFADTRPQPDGLGGIAFCFKLNASGKKYLDPDTREVAEETVRGTVAIAPGEPFTRLDA